METMGQVGDEETPTAKFSIPIHARIESYQGAHGLRHDDYKQYHEYCTRRLSRLRHARPVRKDLVHSATYVSGEKTKRRNAYCPRPTSSSSEHVHHENFLWLPLMGAERAWAHACELKALLGAKPSSSSAAAAGWTAGHEKSKSSPGQIRQHSIRRLKRAKQLATQLQELAMSVGDDQTILEAKAYAGWMRGNYSLEVGDWKSACEEYGSALSICRALSQSSDEENPESLELRDLFTARADNVLLPLLRYCQYEYRDAGGTVVDVDVVPNQDTTSKKSSTSADGGTIHFRGQDVTVENKNLRVLLLKVDGLFLGADASRSDDKFLSMLSAYDDAIAMVSMDLKNYQSMKAGPAVNAKKAEMESLLGYVKYAKLHLLMERNEQMVDELRKESSTSFAEIAHLYDALLQSARAVCNLAGSEVEDEFLLEANANVLRLRAWRCYYAGQLYAASDILPDALALLKQASLLASRASEEIAACEEMEHGNEYLEALEGLRVDIAGATCRVKAQAYLLRNGGGSAGAMSSSSRSLLIRLNDFDGGKKLVDIPPTSIPMPCKPSFFDAAWSHVSVFPMEELQKHIDDNKPQESRGLLGWFRSK